jgi:hypothetical protein
MENSFANPTRERSSEQTMGGGSLHRMLAALCVAAAVVAATAPSASARRIATKWKETQQLHGGATLAMRVPWVDVTRTTWRARVAVENLSGKRIRVTTGAVRGPAQLGAAPFSYYAGPALLWSTHVKSYMGGYALIHSLAARFVQPRLPSSLAPHATWVATIGGSSSKVPRGQRISICFGIFAVVGAQPAFGTSGTVVSTTNAFTLTAR